MLFCTESPETTNEEKKHEQNNKKDINKQKGLRVQNFGTCLRHPRKMAVTTSWVSDVSWRIDEGGEDTCRSASNFFHGHYKIS